MTVHITLHYIYITFSRTSPGVGCFRLIAQEILLLNLIKLWQELAVKRCVLCCDWLGEAGSVRSANERGIRRLNGGRRPGTWRMRRLICRQRFSTHQRSNDDDDGNWIKLIPVAAKMYEFTRNNWKGLKNRPRFGSPTNVHSYEIV